jgi:hypothetical protein
MHFWKGTAFRAVGQLELTHHRLQHARYNALLAVAVAVISPIPIGVCVHIGVSIRVWIRVWSISVGRRRIVSRRITWSIGSRGVAWSRIARARRILALLAWCRPRVLRKLAYFLLGNGLDGNRLGQVEREQSFRGNDASWARSRCRSAQSGRRARSRADRGAYSTTGDGANHGSNRRPAHGAVRRVRALAGSIERPCISNQSDRLGP